MPVGWMPENMTAWSFWPATSLELEIFRFCVNVDVDVDDDKSCRVAETGSRLQHVRVIG